MFAAVVASALSTLIEEVETFVELWLRPASATSTLEDWFEKVLDVA